MRAQNKKSNQGFWKTLKYALLLNSSLYENAHNTPKTRQLALSIVIFSALSHALGSSVILIINLVPLALALALLLLDLLSIIAGYYFWVFTIWKIGQWLKPIDPTFGDLLNPIGFAYAPQVLNFLTLIPLLGRPIELILAVWSLLAVIIAVRQGLDISTNQAALICLVGWPLIQIAIGVLQVTEQHIIRFL
ncbi:hypothetical protein F7734_19615 [Scytonema sp. UIC 10036]|uniref:hypothetical protein n=1 Tax=Scytonema sp. UIC 10036 TaxID=2304196 RepID=UPI0012DAB020|nr:hypothetical protein [Scytonema sp. UIC 10036]MUG94464.1 hypothetical protein [Scytonema sp. UIC 10036]